MTIISKILRWGALVAAASSCAAGALAAPSTTPERIVLPLDHGPRAVTTPALNKKRLEEIRKEYLAQQAQH